tara:strand:- start:12064 stop:12363 length:300 start_codon:yes stop_codon:yes gene_type:complete
MRHLGTLTSYKLVAVASRIGNEPYHNTCITPNHIGVRFLSAPKWEFRKHRARIHPSITVRLKGTKQIDWGVGTHRRLVKVSVLGTSFLDIPQVPGIVWI